MHIITGPIVGAVESTTARIVVEPDGGADVIARARPSGGGPERAPTAASRHSDCPAAMVGRHAKPWSQNHEYDWICLDDKLVNDRNFGRIEITKSTIHAKLVT